MTCLRRSLHERTARESDLQAEPIEREATPHATLPVPRVEHVQRRDAAVVALVEQARVALRELVQPRVCSQSRPPRGPASRPSGRGPAATPQPPAIRRRRAATPATPRAGAPRVRTSAAATGLTYRARRAPPSRRARRASPSRRRAQRQPRSAPASRRAARRRGAGPRPAAAGPASSPDCRPARPGAARPAPTGRCRRRRPRRRSEGE